MAGASGGSFSQDDVKELLRQEREEHQKNLDELRRSLAGMAPAPVPEHSGGPGNEVHDTWSLYEQGLASRGEHPSQQKDEPEQKGK
jgi:hypothetical protein